MTVDLRDVPAYSLLDAARYVRVPRSTLRTWIRGRSYPRRDGRAFFRPLIEVERGTPVALSFVNLIEAHVLAAIRREHGVQLDKVRQAIDYVSKELHVGRPLADAGFETNGVDLFVEHMGKLLNASRSGQLAMRELLQASLRRVERDDKGLPIRFFPVVRGGAESPCLIVIDTRIAFGRPVVAGTGIPTAVVAERFLAGEASAELAMDYDVAEAKIEEALRCELAA